MRIVLLCISLLVGAAQAAADEVRLTNGEWPPYLGQSLPHQGIASRIVAEAFALEGITVQWDFYPWARALMLAQRGQRAGTAVWLRNEQRDHDFYVSDPVVDSSYYLFHRKDHPIDWQDVHDLKGLQIGGANGFDYGAAFQQAEADGSLTVRRQTNEQVGLRQLLAGRIDVFPMDKTVAFDMLHQHFSAAERAQLTFSPKPLRSDTLHLMLSRAVPGNAELIARFNDGLKQLRDSGKIAQYLMEVQQPLSLAP
ncbi:substrate-binding periplasmic protein [Pseudomonas turukhanskensis]|uniref:ABC transporter substrate-binding protein n=1 Tax=Pseudomonas turukhanskensis TaxID=1806536 RepID=A0A9W6K3N5_9PSED|nr:transporter substrate-binding domain-containing protein [Pseudomonas turukhanskensis]GLK88172.1 ABC transporter substrate-binding protein [Pseudomonas turukhanskensis]